MSSIIQDKKTKIFKLLYYDKDKGYTVRESLKTKNKKEAEIKARKRLNEIDMGFTKGVADVPLTGSKKFSEILSECFAVKELSEVSIKHYSESAKHWIHSRGDKPVIAYTKQDWAKFKLYMSKEKNHSQNTQAIHSRQLASIFEYCIKYGYVKESIIENIKPVKIPPEIIPLDYLEEIFSFVKQNFFKQYFYYKLTYLLALRPYEANYLKWEWFDFDEHEIKIWNNKRKRFDTIPMLDDLLEFFAEEVKPLKSGELFGYKNQYAVIGKFERWQKRLLESKREKFREQKRKEGIELTGKEIEKLIPAPQKFYGLKYLRKTRGSRLANLGAKPLFLMEYMRHEDLRTTKTYYTKVDRKAMKKDLNLSLQSPGEALPNHSLSTP